MFGILLQPEFNVTQHKNGINILNSFKILFNGKGQIVKKSGSNNVWVYSLKGISNLHDYIIPFYLKFVVKYSNKYNSKEFNKFVFILNRLKEKSKLSKNEYIDTIKLVYELNPDDKGKKRKRTLPEVLTIIESKNLKNK